MVFYHTLNKTCIELNHHTNITPQTHLKHLNKILIHFQTASINKVTETAALLVDADKLRQSISDPGPDKWVWGRNLAIFLVVRFVFRGNFPTTED